MSYDISFKVKVADTNKYVEVGNCTANITYNVRKIIELSTGLPWVNGENNGLCNDVIPHIEEGLRELQKHPEKYYQYESPNGWGTVAGTIHFFEWVIKDWENYKMFTDNDIVDVTTFWIE